MEERNVTNEDIDFVFRNVLVPLPNKDSDHWAPRESALYYKKQAQKAKQKVLRDPQLNVMFIVMYIEDYKIFNYPIPQMKV